MATTQAQLLELIRAAEEAQESLAKLHTDVHFALAQVRSGRATPEEALCSLQNNLHFCLLSPQSAKVILSERQHYDATWKANLRTRRYRERRRMASPSHTIGGAS